MNPSAIKLRNTYAITPDAPFVQREFGFYSLEQWALEGMPADKDEFRKMAGLEPDGRFLLRGFNFSNTIFLPAFQEYIVEDRGEYEVIQDSIGRRKLCFKGRRDGFMPTYLDHPVKDTETWKNNCKWRMNPDDPARYTEIPEQVKIAETEECEGKMIFYRLTGGYMYLRSIIGAENLLYMFYDNPALIHECMESWFLLADAVTEKYQRHVTIDEIFMAEDITYNHGCFISPEMMREFLFPYYKKLLDNIKKRQRDKNRRLYYQVDTDGNCDPVIPIYGELGMNVISPVEIASGCDVIELGKKYPYLVLIGGVDKRVLAKGPEAIDAYVDRVFPVMKKRGGYIPTCDHGVPPEVSFANWLHYRKRCLEF